MDFPFKKAISSKMLIVSITFAFFSYSCTFNSSPEKREASTPAHPQSLAYDTHSSKNSLDWPGVYQGTLPCADCEGIETRIVLNRDGTFQRSLKYLSREDKDFSDEGEFVWDETGSRITLKAENGDQQYQVGENLLFHLDQEGNRITGDLADMYNLFKNRVDPRLENKKWMLFELRGKPVKTTGNLQEGYIQFLAETGSFSGNNTCNNFFGQYQLIEGDRIRFGQAGSTLMACQDMKTQSQFMEVLQTADNYTLIDTVLSLNKARMAPLARFRLVEP
jgi:copper homeostasis protein (lipoprotein)